MAKIYLSATYQDLKAHRDAVYRILRMLRHDVISMEDYVATDAYPLHKCLADVASSDIYIGLVGWRYGYIPDNDNPEQKSITELEYRQAGTSRQPRLIFLADTDAPWPDKFRDSETGVGGDGRRISAFRGELENATLVSHFRTPDHLAGLVSVAVQRCLEKKPAIQPRGRTRVQQAKCQGLEERLSVFLKDYQSATEQLSWTTNAVDQNKLERQIASLEREMEQLEDKLDAAGCKKLEDLFRNPPVSSEQLRTWCFEAMPGNVPHEIPPDARPLDLIDWLEAKGPLSGGQIPLLLVLQKLLSRVVDAEDRIRLEQYIADIAHRFGIADMAHLAEPTAPKTESSPVLMLEIWPIAPPGNRCSVQGWIVYSPEHSVKVYPQDQEDALDLEREQDLIALVDDLCGLLSKHNVDEKNVVMEFILPRELLGQAVEQWTDSYGDPLGMRFPVVVRPRERLRDPRQQLGWATCWEYLSAHCKNALCDSLWWFDESKRREVRGKLQEGPCIALCFVPDLLAPPRQNALLYLLHHGASVMLWPRREAADWTQQFRTFIAAKTVADLPEMVCDVRYKLWEKRQENTPCYNFTLLWDDPNRRIPDEGFLQGPTES